MSGVDTVEVAEGSYVENINFNGKNIVLTSTDPNSPANTIIDGSNSGTVVTFSGSETSACLLTGFKITNGYAYPQGGGISGNGTHAIISNCFVSGNIVVGNCSEGYSGGGGLYGCDGQIINCMITDNIAWDDGGCVSGGYGGGMTAQ